MSLSTGAIIGIIIIAALVALGGPLALYLVRRKRQREAAKHPERNIDTRMQISGAMMAGGSAAGGAV